MKRHFWESEKNRSAKTIDLPSGNSTDKYEVHFPSAYSGNTAESDGSPYWKDAPRREQRHFAGCPSATIDASIISSFGELLVTTPGVPAFLSGLKKPICNCALVSRHFPKIKNASADEMFVMQLILSFGTSEARLIATHLRLKLPTRLFAHPAKRPILPLRKAPKHDR